MTFSGRFIPAGQLPQIVVVGSVNLDLVARVEQLPRPGETVSSTSLSQLPGGKGANQAVAAARLGAETAMLGRLGDDSFASVLRKSLTSSKVDTTHLLTSPGCSSGVALIGVDSGGQNSITIVSGANGQVTPHDVEQWDEVLVQADAVLLQLEIPHETVEAVLRRCKACGVLTVLDPAPSPKQSPGSWMYLADVLTPNQTEAEQLVGFPVQTEADATRAAEELQRRGASTVIVKRGEEGACYADETGHTGHVSALSVGVQDTTAAGDAFNAAFAVACVEGKTVREAVRFGCVTGSLATTLPGAQPALPTRKRVQEFLREFPP